MSSLYSGPATNRYTVMDSVPHSLHECRGVEDFVEQFERATGGPLQKVLNEVVLPTAPCAAYLVGSLPLGMGTPGSDIDVIVLVDSKDALAKQPGRGSTNSDQRLAFSNESDPLRAGEFLTVINGLTVDVTVLITSSVKAVYTRLRSRGPELSDSEIMMLGRLRMGWLLCQSEGFLKASGLKLTDVVLDVYCCTKHYVAALAFLNKATKALGLKDIPLALHLGRLGVESAYLAYLATEGLCYLGPKWLAQIGSARGAEERLWRVPRLREGAHLLFPSGDSRTEEATRYLEEVGQFLGAMKRSIEEKTLFRIAFSACPQIAHTASER